MVISTLYTLSSVFYTVAEVDAEKAVKFLEAEGSLFDHVISRGRCWIVSTPKAYQKLTHAMDTLVETLVVDEDELFLPLSHADGVEFFVQMGELRECQEGEELDEGNFYVRGDAYDTGAKKKGFFFFSRDSIGEVIACIKKWRSLTEKK